MKNTCLGACGEVARRRSVVPAFAPASDWCWCCAAPLGPVAENHPHRQTPDNPTRYIRIACSRTSAGVLAQLLLELRTPTSSLKHRWCVLYTDCITIIIVVHTGNMCYVGTKQTTKEYTCQSQASTTPRVASVKEQPKTGTTAVLQ